MNFLEELVRQGVLTEDNVAGIVSRANQKFDGNIDQALVDSGLPESQVLELKSKFFGVPAKAVSDAALTTDVLKFFPEDSARHYNAVPIGLVDGVLEVGVLDPENIQALDAIRFIASKMNAPYKIFLITLKDYNHVLENYKGISGQVDQALSELDSEIAAASADDVLVTNPNAQENLKPGEEERIVEEAPIIKIVAVIINHATEGNASDIHIENTGDKVKVRFRVDGILHTSLVLPVNVYAGIVARIKILAKLRLDEKRKPQDGSFSAKVLGRKVDFRVSTFPSYYGEKVVMRILDSQRGVKPLDQLHMSQENLALVKAALGRPYGLILITGPTGSGKTTTLYSMLNELDKETYNIVSLEDPVEYNIDGINQSQVMPEIGYTFSSGLRSILRQDPDIIMVGEIRDKETAQLAIQAALTGHLVLSTLHTNNSIGVVPRLVDMGVDPYLIAPTLILSIAQRLVRVVCEGAGKEIPMDESTRIMIDKQFKDLPPEVVAKLPIGKTMYEVTPTSDCPSGTRGRIGVFEMFPVDKDMQNVILKNPVEGEISKLARSKGMLTMREDAILKGLKGEIPFQEVYNFN